MKSHDQSHDGSNLIGTISYLPKIELLLVIRYLIYLNFSVNLYDQPFKSTYAINIFNQPILNQRHHWLVVHCFFKCIYVG